MNAGVSLFGNKETTCSLRWRFGVANLIGGKKERFGKREEKGRNIVSTRRYEDLLLKSGSLDGRCYGGGEGNSYGRRAGLTCIHHRFHIAVVTGENGLVLDKGKVSVPAYAYSIHNKRL